MGISDRMLELPPQVEAITTEEVEAWFNANPKRIQALEAFCAGHQVKAFCGALEISRQTFYDWRKHPAFLAAAYQQVSDFATSRKLQRLKANAKFTDYIGKKIRQAIEEDEASYVKEVEAARLESRPVNPKKFKDNSDKVGKLLSYWRAQRGEERADLGETEQRIVHQVSGGVTVGPVLETEVRSWLSGLVQDSRKKDNQAFRKVAEVVVEPDALEDPSKVANGVLGLVEEAITRSPDLLDELYDDAQDAEDERKKR